VASGTKDLTEKVGIDLPSQLSP